MTLNNAVLRIRRKSNPTYGGHINGGNAIHMFSFWLLRIDGNFKSIIAQNFTFPHYYLKACNVQIISMQICSIYIQF